MRAAPFDDADKLVLSREIAIVQVQMWILRSLRVLK